MDCTVMSFHISGVIRGAVERSGLRSKDLGSAGSVANAKAASVSMIRLSQRS